MAYDLELSERVRNRLQNFPGKKITEKKMFGGLAFLVNGKMCINVSKDRLMCRFDPEIEEKVKLKKGFSPMIMKGKTLKGYCYVEKSGFISDKDFDYWINICLDYSKKAKSSKRK